MSAETAEIQDFGESIYGYEINSESTRRKYTLWAGRFEAWKPEGEPDLEMVRDFDSFLADEEADVPWTNARGPPVPTEYAYRTRVQATSAIKLWSRYQYDARLVEDVQDMVRGEPAPFEPTVLSRSEVDRVLQSASVDCDNPDCDVALRVGYDAILRGAELANVRYDDVDFEEQGLRVDPVKKSGSNPTTVKLSTDVWNRLASFAKANADRDYLFRNSYGRAWKPAAINMHIRRKHCDDGSHALFRHSAITNRLRRGEDFGQVYLRARHSNPSTTLRYASIAGVDAPGWVE